MRFKDIRLTNFNDYSIVDKFINYPSMNLLGVFGLVTVGMMEKKLGLAKCHNIKMEPMIGTSLRSLYTLFLVLEVYKNNLFIIDLDKYKFMTEISGYVIIDNSLKLREYCVNGKLYKNAKCEDDNVSKLRNALFHIINYYIHSKQHALITTISEVARDTLGESSELRRLITTVIHNKVARSNDIYGYFFAFQDDINLNRLLNPNLNDNFINNQRRMTPTATNCYMKNLRSINNLIVKRHYNKTFRLFKRYFHSVDNFSSEFVDEFLSSTDKNNIKDTILFSNKVFEVIKSSGISVYENKSLSDKLKFILQTLFNSTFIHYYSMRDTTSPMVEPTIFGSDIHFEIVSIIKEYMYNVARLENDHKSSKFLLNNKIVYENKKLNKIMNNLFKIIYDISPDLQTSSY